MEVSFVLRVRPLILRTRFVPGASSSRNQEKEVGVVGENKPLLKKLDSGVAKNIRYSRKSFELLSLSLKLLLSQNL